MHTHSIVERTADQSKLYRLVLIAGMIVVWPVHVHDMIQIVHCKPMTGLSELRFNFAHVHLTFNSEKKS